MSELPERKALKEILLKLKTRTFTAENNYRITTSNSLQKLEEAIKVYRDQMKVETNDTAIIVHLKGTLEALVDAFFDRFNEMIFLSHGVCDDLKLYIDSLEIYSTELDKTLTDIFEQAKKQAEEQIKQQEEIMKRKSPESYIK